MQIFHKLEDVPAIFAPTLLTLGNFDGVHRAHTHMLQELVGRAKQQNAKAMAVTFEPHPMRILRPDYGLKLITPLPEKLRLLEATGLDAVLPLAFGQVNALDIDKAHHGASASPNFDEAALDHVGSAQFAPQVPGKSEERQQLGQVLLQPPDHPRISSAPA